MLSDLVLMINSDNDGRFEDKEDLEDDGLDARETQEDHFLTGSDAAGSIQSGNAADNHLPAQLAQIRSTAMRAMIAFLAELVLIF